jgi:hypothetical protein
MTASARPRRADEPTTTSVTFDERPMTAPARGADDYSTGAALWADSGSEAPPPSKDSPLADDMGATMIRPAKPVLQQGTHTTVHREVRSRDRPGRMDVRVHRSLRILPPL